MWGCKLMPYEEDKLLHDEFEDVRYKFRLKSALLKPVVCRVGEVEE